MRNDSVWRVIGCGVVTLALGTTTAVPQVPGGVAVPAPVRKAFEQAYPGVAIAKATEERESGRVLVRVDSVDRGRRRLVLYDLHGSVVEVAEQVEEKDLPAPVAAAMHSHPRAIFVTALKATRGGAVEYRLTVRGTRKTSLVAKPDGTVLSFQ